MGKLTQQIAGAYIGAQVEATGIGTYGISHISASGIMVDTGERFKYTPYDQCRLILTPLSHITDEDAVEVAKILLYIPSIRNERNSKDVLPAQYQISESGMLFFVYADITAPACKTYIDSLGAEVIDYLRSRNYDLGYMGIRSLIDAGIAISSTDKTETK